MVSQYNNSCCKLGNASTDTNYDSAKVLLITFVVNNHVDEELNGPAEAWEKAFLDYLKNYKGEYITVSFMAEVGVVRAFLGVVN